MPARIATYNYGDPKATALDRLATLADFICTQEGGDRDPDVATFRRNHPGWDVFGADLDKQRGKTPILYNAARFEVLDSGAVPMDDGEGAGKPGAGGGERKWLLWLLVRDRETGAEFYVANTHAVPSLKYRNRRLHHAEHMRRIAVWSRSLTRPAVVVGDFNAKWSHDHLDPLRAAGFRLANGPEWTHQKGALKRRIDLILVRGAKVLSAEVVDTPSDHRAVVAVLDAPAVVKPEEPAVKFVPYSEWSRRSRGATTSSHPIGSTRGVSLHWEGPHMGAFSHDRCADKVRGIQAYHRDTKKWADIAYNAVVCPHGYVFEGRGIGVQSAANGYTEANESHYAVCYLGGEGDGFTTDGKQGFRDAVAWLRKGGAGLEVNGHRDHKSTACPGDEIYRWLNTTDFSDLTPTTEDDMPSMDELKKELAPYIADLAAKATHTREIGGGDNRGPARLHWIWSSNNARAAAAQKVDEAALAAAVVAALPTGTIDEATVVRGFKRALAELVNDKES